MGYNRLRAFKKELVYLAIPLNLQPMKSLKKLWQIFLSMFQINFNFSCRYFTIDFCLCILNLYYKRLRRTIYN